MINAIKDFFDDKDDPSHCARAVGDVKELKRLHQAGYAWSFHTTWNAATGHHLDSLRYAVEHGCPLLKCWRLLAYVVTPPFNDELYNRHLKKHLLKIDTLRYLHEECHYPLYPVITGYAAGHDQLPSLQYLVEHGCLLDPEIEEMARKNSPDCYKYLLEHNLLPVETIEESKEWGKLGCWLCGKEKIPECFLEVPQSLFINGPTSEPRKLDDVISGDR